MAEKVKTEEVQREVIAGKLEDAVCPVRQQRHGEVNRVIQL